MTKFCSDIYSRATILKDPALWGPAFSLFVVIVSLGIGIITWQTESYKTTARFDLLYRDGASLSRSIESYLQVSVAGSFALAAYVKGSQSCDDLELTFANFSAQLLSHYANINSVEFDIQNIVGGNLSLVYPPFSDDLKHLNGCNLLDPNQTCYSIDREKELIAISRKELYFSGPMQTDNIYGLFAILPIWNEVSSPGDAILGCDSTLRQKYCPDSFCYDASSKTKFFGMSSSLVNVNSLFDGTFYAYNFLDGHSFVLRVADLGPDDYNSNLTGSVIYSKGVISVNDPVKISINIFNLMWELEIAPSNGWTPSWFESLIIGAVFVALLFAALLLRILVLGKKYYNLLGAMLPKKAIDHLQQYDSLMAENFDIVTVLFADIVEYTVISSVLSPLQVVNLLNDLYTEFDILVKKHGVYKVETIGDSYMCSVGCPIKEDPHLGALKMVCLAQDMVRTVRSFKSASLTQGMKLRVRVGIHTGPIVGGIVGKIMPRYCLFGDTVNVASRMESFGESMKIHISQSTAALLEGRNLKLISRPEMFIKGKGRMKTFFVDLSNEEEDISLNLQELGQVSVSNLTDCIAIEIPEISGDLDCSQGVQSYPDLGFTCRIFDWDLNFLNITEIGSLVAIAETIFIASGATEIGINKDTLRLFIKRVAAGYKNNRFHNFQHAVCVLHFTFKLITTSCFGSTDNYIPLSLPLFVKFCILVGALVHDLAHPGHTNAFEIKTDSILAKKYDNESVLENNSISVTLDIIKKPGSNLFENMTARDEMFFKRVLTASLLATDLSNHKNVVNEIREYGSSSQPLNFLNVDTQVFIARAIIHVADLSNPARTFMQTFAWAGWCAEEHRNQAQAERALGFTPVPTVEADDVLITVENEIKFIDIFVLPLFEAYAELFPSNQFLVEKIKENKNEYLRLSLKIQSFDELTVQLKKEGLSAVSSSSSRAAVYLNECITEEFVI